ncbi:hypothetical protein [Oryzobacter telluris]|uniref:hypothetical protein n=1 Tax=Oryzobacter telluris TaxID=3149179 RepID=UPI00370DC4E6
MKHRTIATWGVVALATIAGSPVAQAASIPSVSSFTVVTSFLAPSSPIVAADGLWEGCTGVTDLGGYANQVSPSKVRFSGEKQVHCEGGDVVIHYDAEMNFRGPDSRDRRTFGTWSVVSSDEGAPVVGGGGRVEGVNRGCQDCIVDTFSGRVY